jgi:hypothetical protein
MIWDRVAKIVETLYGYSIESGKDTERAGLMRDVMQRAHLFVIDAAPQDFLPTSYTQEQCDFFKANFFLPFRTIAIEDKGSLIFLFDVEKHQRGLSCPRRWVEFLPGDMPLDGFRERDDPEAQAAFKDLPKARDKMMVTSGEITTVIPRAGEKTYIEGDIQGIILQDMETCEVILDGKIIKQQFGTEMFQKLCNAGIRNALQAIDEVMYFNDPTNFIVQEIPKSVRRRQASGAGKDRIQRSHDRPIYTVLKPTQIRRKLRLPDPQMPGGIKRRPHERRTHLRTYSNDEQRWPQAHGKTVVVKGCWIGPSEAEVDGKIYKVLVNMRPPQMPQVASVEE